MSLAISGPSSKVTKQGGMLLNLPPELRDMIYRYVLTGTYSVCAQPHPILIRDLTETSPNLSILRVSKTISDEAMAVLYSESTFRIHVHFETSPALQLPSIVAVERMMNIELDVKIRHLTWKQRIYCRTGSCVKRLDSSKQIWKDTLDCISRSNNLRNSLNIRWRRIFSEVNFGREPQCSNLNAIIPDWMFWRLKSMTLFRTVILQIFAHDIDTSVRKWKGYFDKTETNAIRNHLTPTLGPADRVLIPHHPERSVSLIFHPQKHIAARPMARAADLRAKADELDSEARRAEEGGKNQKQGQHLMDKDLESGM